MRLARAAFLFAALLPQPAFSADGLEGPFQQGQLVVATAPKGAKVFVDGKAVRVAPDGRFVIGFGRDAPPATTVRFALPDGTQKNRKLAIGKRQYKITRIDGLPPAKVSPKPADVARIKADNQAIGGVRRADSAFAGFVSGFQWPLSGRRSGVFGSQRVLNGKPRQAHSGVDIAAPEGTLVLATADGVVALARADMFLTGTTLMIDHGHGLSSIYAHMSAILVKQGQRVSRGDSVGRVGQTGRATGPHLHWGITLFRTHLDPESAAGPWEGQGKTR